ncbi:MAG: 4'-phosphopantetheinyl transferase superfamily protein [Firmicutes bacterium]|nr:4'-phosphopantetheinyl transferase superfamily protein [Bacillota bacterium]
MFHIYLYEGKDIKGEASEALVREAACAYCQQQEIIPGEAVETSLMTIQREEKGKPYFTDLPLEFNVSHSGYMWVCIMGETPCGIDIQEIRDCGYTKIAAKHFSRYEQSFVMKLGLRGFFQIWTRHEAFGKYTGAGLLMESMPAFVDDTGRLLPWVMYEEKKVYLRELDLGSQIVCTYCNEEEEDEIQIFG